MPRHPLTHARALHVLILGVMVAASPGCWLKRKGIAPPSVAQPVTELQRLSTRLQAVHTVLERDVARMETLRLEFFSAPSPLYAPPFPVELFRHVALSCLNELPHPAEESMEGGAPQSQEDAQEPGQDAAAAPELVLTCQPVNLELLLGAVSPARKSFTMEQLRRVDEMRTLRLKVARRLEQLPRMIEEAQLRVARQRAERRQLSEKLDQRRIDYDDTSWALAQKNLQRYAQEIDTVERSITQLTDQLSASHSWRWRAQDTTRVFLYDLVWIGEVL